MQFVVLVPLGTILGAIGAAFAGFFVTGGLMMIGNYLTAHPAVFFTLLIITAIIGTVIKTMFVASDDDNLWGISAIFCFLSTCGTILFLFMYPIPLWVYNGGFHALIETVAGLIFLTIGKALFSGLFCAPFYACTDECTGPVLAFVAFASKLATIFVLYLLNVDGIKYYLFDFLGIMAPFT